MTPQEKSRKFAKECFEKCPYDERCYDYCMRMYEWTKQQLQDDFMQKAEKAYCNQCIKNPCRIKIEHSSLCYECELFLKSILKEL